MRRLDAVAVAQGAYYAATGLWALVHLPSFVWVTGPKNDLWLVQTVAVLVLAVGVGLAAAGLRRAVTAELATIAVLAALGLAAVEIWYALAGSVRAVYLLDAVVELGLVAAWAFAGLNPIRRAAGSRA